jgi:hypothetical protein
MMVFAIASLLSKSTVVSLSERIAIGVSFLKARYVTLGGLVCYERADYNLVRGQSDRLLVALRTINGLPAPKASNSFSPCKRVRRTPPPGSILDQHLLSDQVLDVAQGRILRAFGELGPFG